MPATSVDREQAPRALRPERSRWLPRLSAALVAWLLLGLGAGHRLAAQSTSQPPAPAATATPPADLSKNRELVQRYIEEVLSRGGLEHLDQLVAPGYIDSSPGADEGAAGPALVRAAQGRVRALFSRISYRIDHLIAEGDKVVARYLVRATFQPSGQTGSPLPGTGTEVWINGMTIFRIASGRIEESWTINDQLEMYRQLGYTLEPPKAAANPGEPR
jgi:predicted ester cyclase